MYGPASASPPDAGGRGRGRGPGVRVMTPKGQMSGNVMTPAITSLPPHLKVMFDPRAPVKHERPIKKPKPAQITGLAQYATLFESEKPPPREPFVTHKERKEKQREILSKTNEEKIALELEDFNPSKNDKATEDPYKTLMVARLSHDTTEKKLRREFEQYGPIKTIRTVFDDDQKPRGYAFIEYEREADMRTAYKRADGRKIDGRRVLVDVERGRTVKGWRPRRLGGGLGNSRAAKEPGGRPTARDEPGRAGQGYESRIGDDRRARSRSRERMGRPDVGGRGGGYRDGPGHYGRPDRDSYRDGHKGGGGYRDHNDGHRGGADKFGGGGGGYRDRGGYMDRGGQGERDGHAERDVKRRRSRSTDREDAIKRERT